KRFVVMPSKDRLLYVAEMIEEKNKSKAEEFLNTLVTELCGKKLETHTKTIKEILTLLKYLKDRSPSLKLILERVALLDL
ncbi:MAG: hypothetical protein Q7R72_03065, partial [bacterium]|nr:hypothetical protein [bacterium]